MFDKKTRTAIKINTNNFGDGLAGRGLGLNNTIAELRPLVTQRGPRAAQPRRAGDRPARAVRRRSTAPPRRRRRSPQQNAELLRRPRHVLHGLGERRAVDRSRQQGRAGVARTGDLLAAARGAVLRKRDRVHAPAAPQRELAAHGRAAARPRLQRRRGQPRRRDRPEHAPRRILQGARGIRPEPGRHARARRLHADARNRQPAARRDRARAGRTATTGRSRSATSRASSRRTSASARSRARARCSRRRASTTRAYPSSAPANGPSTSKKRPSRQHGDRRTTTTCTTTPTRT